MIRKLTLAIVTCPTSSILIQNHSAFHEHFANKRQMKASLSLEIVKKTSRDRMQRRKKVCRPKKVVHVLLYEEPIKLKLKFHYPRVSPGDQSLTRSRRNSGLEIERWLVIWLVFSKCFVKKILETIKIKTKQVTTSSLHPLLPTLMPFQTERAVA